MSTNYLEHQIKVKYVDGLLNQSREWQWFIDYIEENYELHNINTWDEFTKNKHKITDIYSHFIKIADLQLNNISFNNRLVEEIFMIAQFFQGKITDKDISGFEMLPLVQKGLISCSCILTSSISTTYLSSHEDDTGRFNIV